MSISETRPKTSFRLPASIHITVQSNQVSPRFTFFCILHLLILLISQLNSQLSLEQSSNPAIRCHDSVPLVTDLTQKNTGMFRRLDVDIDVIAHIQIQVNVIRSAVVAVRLRRALDWAIVEVQATPNVTVAGPPLANL